MLGDGLDDISNTAYFTALKFIYPNYTEIHTTLEKISKAVTPQRIKGVFYEETLQPKKERNIPIAETAVLDILHEYYSKPAVGHDNCVQALMKKYAVKKKVIISILRGVSYAHLYKQYEEKNGPLQYRNTRLRKPLAKVARQILLDRAQDPKGNTLRVLAYKYDTSEKAISELLNGNTYRDIYDDVMENAECV